MKKILISIFCVFIYFSSNAQSATFEWVNSIGSESIVVARGIAIDDGGSVYAIGSFNGTVDMDPGSGEVNFSTSNGTNCYITKVDPQGNLLWARQIGSDSSTVIPKAIQLDAAGNIYVIGEFQSAVDFDPGEGVVVINGFMVAFIIKLDNNGDFEWVKTFESSPGSCRASGIALDAEDNLYITGDHLGSIDFDPGDATFILTAEEGFTFNAIYICKLSSAGDFIWAKHTEYQQGGSMVFMACYDIALDTEGNIYTTGYSTGAPDFDPNEGQFFLPLIPSGAFIWKLTTDGDFLWATVITGTSQVNVGRSIAVGASGAIYYGGSFSGTIDFDPDPDATYELTSIAGYPDIFILKLDGEGNFIWAKKMGGATYDFAHDIALDLEENIYATGWFQGTSDFDPGVGTFEMASIGPEGVYVMKMTEEGGLVWAVQLGGATTSYTWETLVLSLAVDGENNLYTTGSFNQEMDFDPGVGIFNLNSGEQYDAFILKLSEGTDQVSETNKMEGLFVYPIPADDKVNLAFNLPQQQEVNYSITDLSGKSIFISSKLGTRSGSVSEQIDVSNLSQGIYVLNISVNDKVYTKRLVVN